MRQHQRTGNLHRAARCTVTPQLRDKCICERVLFVMLILDIRVPRPLRAVCSTKETLNPHELNIVPVCSASKPANQANACLPASPPARLLPSRYETAPWRERDSGHYSSKVDLRRGKTWVLSWALSVKHSFDGDSRPDSASELIHDLILSLHCQS